MFLRIRWLILRIVGKLLGFPVVPWAVVDHWKSKPENHLEINYLVFGPMPEAHCPACSVAQDLGQSLPHQPGVLP